MFEERARENPHDWRFEYSQSIIQAVGDTSLTKLPYIITPVLPQHFKESVDRYIPKEALELSSTRRLFGKAQNDLMGNRALGLDLTRGGHTVDVMCFTVSLLTRLADDSPELFAKAIERYGMSPDDLIKHVVEYMRLHDILTLDFAGPLHKKIMFAGGYYNENVALKEVLKGTSEYQFMADSIFDKATTDYYQKSGIDRSKVRQIAEDAIKGEGIIGQVVKGKRGVDWFSYTTRDFSELMRAFNIDQNRQFLDVVQDVLHKLQEYEHSLSAGEEYVLPERSEALPQQIEQLLSTDIIRLEPGTDMPEIIYDADSMLQTYVKHIILRLFYSGSSWRRGHDKIIHDYYLGISNVSPDEIVKRLFDQSEDELLSTDLADMYAPYSREPHMGWYYTTDAGLGGNPEEFELNEKISGAIVERGNRTMKDAFPKLFNITDQKLPDLFLMHSVN